MLNQGTPADPIGPHVQRIKTGGTSCINVIKIMAMPEGEEGYEMSTWETVCSFSKKVHGKGADGSLPKKHYSNGEDYAIL